MTKAMLIPPLPLLPSALLNAISLGLGGGGTVISMLAISSLGEHADVIVSLLVYVFGILLVVLGFIIRDWKLKQDAMAQEQNRHSGRIARLEEKERNGGKLIDELNRQVEFFFRDQRVTNDWLVERLYQMAPHLGEKLQLPPLHARPHDSQEIKKG